MCKYVRVNCIFLVQSVHMHAHVLPIHTYMIMWAGHRMCVWSECWGPHGRWQYYLTEHQDRERREKYLSLKLDLLLHNYDICSGKRSVWLCRDFPWGPRELQRPQGGDSVGSDLLPEVHGGTWRPSQPGKGLSYAVPWFVHTHVPAPSHLWSNLPFPLLLHILYCTMDLNWLNMCTTESHAEGGWGYWDSHSRLPSPKNFRSDC